MSALIGRTGICQCLILGVYGLSPNARCCRQIKPCNQRDWVCTSKNPDSQPSLKRWVGLTAPKSRRVANPFPAKHAKKDSYFIDIPARARYVPPFVNNSIDFGRSNP